MNTYTISYTLTDGLLPIRVRLFSGGPNGTLYSENVHSTHEVGYFYNVPEGGYFFSVLDSTHIVDPEEDYCLKEEMIYLGDLLTPTPTMSITPSITPSWGATPTPSPTPTITITPTITLSPTPTSTIKYDTILDVNETLVAVAYSHGLGDDDIRNQGQPLIINGQIYEISVFCLRVGSPNMNMRAKIYEGTPVHHQSGFNFGDLVATSINVISSTILPTSGSYEECKFLFNYPEISGLYSIVVEWEDVILHTGINYVKISLNNGTPIANYDSFLYLDLFDRWDLDPNNDINLIIKYFTITPTPTPTPTPTFACNNEISVESSNGNLVSYGSERTYPSQSFSLTGDIKSIQFNIVDEGSPDFDLSFEIYDGLFTGSTAPPTNTLIATSTNTISVVDDISSVPGWKKFYFNNVSVSGDFTIMEKTSNVTTHNSSNRLSYYNNNGNLYTNGTMTYYSLSNWNQLASTDLMFILCYD